MKINGHSLPFITWANLLMFKMIYMLRVDQQGQHQVHQQRQSQEHQQAINQVHHQAINSELPLTYWCVTTKHSLSLHTAQAPLTTRLSHTSPQQLPLSSCSSPTQFSCSLKLHLRQLRAAQWLTPIEESTASCSTSGAVRLKGGGFM